MESIRLNSYAKINLTLDVLGIMDNGYHKLEMIMQSIGLHDEIRVRWMEDNRGKIDIELKTNRKYLPVDERNIAYKAALLMAELYGKGRSGMIRIDIGKNIPVAAGLAGGSGNGGAVLLAVNQLWNLSLPLEKLMELGKKLGSDVPFTMMSICACSEGIAEYLKDDPMAVTAALATYDGTVLHPVTPLKAHLILSKPPISVSTKEVYQNIDSIDIIKHPDTKGMIEALNAKNVESAAKKMCNVLELYSAIKYNCIMNTKDKMQECEGSIGVLMSGSGPTVFGIMKSREAAEVAMVKLAKLNKETYVTETMTL